MPWINRKKNCGRVHHVALEIWKLKIMPRRKQKQSGVSKQTKHRRQRTSGNQEKDQRYYKVSRLYMNVILNQSATPIYLLKIMCIIKYWSIVLDTIDTDSKTREPSHRNTSTLINGCGYSTLFRFKLQRQETLWFGHACITNIRYIILYLLTAFLWLAIIFPDYWVLYHPLID